MTPARQAALRKAQLASAATRRGRKKLTPLQRAKRNRKIVLGTALGLTAVGMGVGSYHSAKLNRQINAHSNKIRSDMIRHKRAVAGAQAKLNKLERNQRQLYKHFARKRNSRLN
jgi:hypothetical protein